MRIDKYLKVSRIMKRRTISRELAKNQRVEINGRPVKPSHEVNVGDTVSVTFGRRKLTVVVKSLDEVKKKADAGTMYEVVSEELLPETDEDSNI